MASRHRVWRPFGALALAAAPWVVIFSGVIALVVLLAITLWAILRPDPEISRYAGGAEFFNPPLPSGVISPSSVSSPAFAPPPPPPAFTAAPSPSPSASRPPRRSSPPASPSASPVVTATVTVRDAFTVLPATPFDASSGVGVTAGDGGKAAGPLGDGDWIRYDDIDFGTSGPVDFLARLSSGLEGGGSGLVQIRLDGTGGTPIGDFAVDNTGGWQSWRSVPGNVARPTGVHDVYLTFRSAQPADFVAISWFTFRH